MAGQAETRVESASREAVRGASVVDTAFISYAREDGDFVRDLHGALAERDHQCWVDWGGLHPTAKWMDELKDAIDGARAFIFVISPDSSTSDVCRQELEHAESVKKRVIPILRRDVEPSTLPEALSSRQWVFFREEDNF